VRRTVSFIWTPVVFFMLPGPDLTSRISGK
jgi:hypothetical protein